MFQVQLRPTGTRSWATINETSDEYGAIALAKDQAKFGRSGHDAVRVIDRNGNEVYRSSL